MLNTKLHIPLAHVTNFGPVNDNHTIYYYTQVHKSTILPSEELLAVSLLSSSLTVVSVSSSESTNNQCKTRPSVVATNIMPI